MKDTACITHHLPSQLLPILAPTRAKERKEKELLEIHLETPMNSSTFNLAESALLDEKRTAETLDDTEETSVSKLSMSSSVEDSDEDDDFEDENANLKSIQRLKPLGGSGMRRNASMQSFLTRSQRLVELGADQPPSPEEAKARKVQFKEDPIVHEIPSIAEDDAIRDILFLTDCDFDRMDADMKLTHFRWQNHLAGRIPFDEVHNTIRGLEFFDRDQQMAKDLDKYRHRQIVLGEYVDQKKKARSTADVDFESVRRVSLLRSSDALQRAIEQGAADEVTRRTAWEPVVAAPTEKDTNAKSKKKKRHGLMFWKK